MEKIIKIAEDFSAYPSGRVIADGPNSGQRLREDFLLPALENYEKTILIIDDVVGYPSSFIEEAFGGLVKVSKFSKDEILEKIEFHYTTSIYSGYKNEMIEAIKVATKDD